MVQWIPSAEIRSELLVKGTRKRLPQKVIWLPPGIERLNQFPVPVVDVYSNTSLVPTATNSPAPYAILVNGPPGIVAPKKPRDVQVTPFGEVRILATLLVSPAKT